MGNSRPGGRSRTAPRHAAAAGLVSGDSGGADGIFPCRIEILQSPLEHVGLGTGTQLSLAIAAGLNALLGRGPLDAHELAVCSGRGERSAIGVHGFVHGGLLFEAGKSEGEAISPLVDRVELPAGWRFVLVRPRGARGLFGEAERAAFAQLPPVPPERAAELECEAAEHLLPSAAAAQFEEFSESLYHFGYTAGLSFAASQDGTFAGPRLADLVARIRRGGIRGVGQSSWGPTLFALFPDEGSAAEFLEYFDCSEDDLDLRMAAPDNRGARIEMAIAEE